MPQSELARISDVLSFKSTKINEDDQRRSKFDKNLRETPRTLDKRDYFKNWHLTTRRKVKGPTKNRRPITTTTSNEIIAETTTIATTPFPDEEAEETTTEIEPFSDREEDVVVGRNEWRPFYKVVRQQDQDERKLEAEEEEAEQRRSKSFAFLHAPLQGKEGIKRNVCTKVACN